MKEKSLGSGIMGQGLCRTAHDASFRHETHLHQFRAMFVLNCVVRKGEALRAPAPKEKWKKKKRGGESESDAGEQGKDEWASDKDVVHPVACAVCNTIVRQRSTYTYIRLSIYTYIYVSIHIYMCVQVDFFPEPSCRWACTTPTRYTISSMCLLARPRTLGLNVLRANDHLPVYLCTFCPRQIGYNLTPMT